MKDIITYSVLNKFSNIAHGTTTKSCTFNDLLKSIGCNDIDAVIPKQVHQNAVIIVDPTMKGKGEDFYIGDSLATNIRNIGLVIRTADCLPIFLYDKDKEVIGLIHAGWRGLESDIIGAFVARIKKIYNINEESLTVAIGPAINKNCYEVGNDVVGSLSGIYNYLNEFIEEAGRNKCYLDLKLLSKRRLLQAGVREENIEISDLCTHCNSDLFYSFRRDKGKLGNIYSALCLKD